MDNPFALNCTSNMAPYRASVASVMDVLRNYSASESLAVLNAAKAELELLDAIHSRIVREAGKQNRIQNQA